MRVLREDYIKSNEQVGLSPDKFHVDQGKCHTKLVELGVIVEQANRQCEDMHRSQYLSDLRQSHM